MWQIKQLPQHLINKLKAGEIVERPASVIKELVENSLDAGATRIDITVAEWGKSLIQVADNGSGIMKEDMLLTVERYATSKIADERDLGHIESYGFRGEALASIAEVSSFRLQSKTASASTGVELRKDGEHFQLKEIAFAHEHGTTVSVEDIFHAIPAREKFLKAPATERNYIRQTFIHYALIHRDKHRSLTKDGKQNMQLAPAQSLAERILALTKQERQPHLKEIAYQDSQLSLYGLVGDASLHFPSGQYMRIVVNGRPVQDRLLKKSIMDAYSRQIVPGSYPFACIFVEIDPSLLDVNVHPRKSEVKFLDPGSMFTRLKESIQWAIGEQKVNYAAYTKHPVQQQSSIHIPSSSEKAFFQSSKQANYGAGSQAPLEILPDVSMDWWSLVPPSRDELRLDGVPVRLVGQCRNMYILLEWADHFYRVDQHALAERITFEKMRTAVKQDGYQPEPLLQSVITTYPETIEITPLLDTLARVGFDVSVFGDGKIIVHAVPKVFVTYQMDIELLLNQLWGSSLWTEERGGGEHEVFGAILDEILWMKACKASIKAGQKLSLPEMEQLIKDGTTYIDGMFVCQHGRPSVVAVPKGEVDRLFDR